MRRTLRRTARAGALAAFMSLLACGGGDGSTGPGGPAPVATLILSGAPAGPLLIGSTVRLSVTALSASGSTVSDAQITWKSSDETLATVSPAGVVAGVGVGSVTIIATSGDGRATATLDVRAGSVVGPAGGTFSMLGGRAVLVIRPNRVWETTTLIVGPAAAPTAPADPRIVPGTALVVEPQLYLWDANLTLAYDATALPTGAHASGLQLYHVTGGRWSPIPRSTVDSVARRVSASVQSTGVFAVGFTPVDQVRIGGDGVSGALYAGQSAGLTATVYDANGIELSARQVSWTSSSDAIATVDASGVVTAVGAGTVTITATSEGKSANTTLLIMSRPMPDWSRAADWTTYQGNARRTGHVPVTADPALFRERWVATPSGGSRLNPVSTGEGRVYVSTDLYHQAQKIAALDHSTGAMLWSYDMNTEGLDAPAYANGAVYVQSSGHANSYLWSFDAGTGALRFRSSYGNQWSHYHAPAIVDGAVYMAGGSDGGAYSFTVDDGTERWFATTNKYDEWAPAVDDGRVYAYTGSHSPKVSVLDAGTGAVVYEIPDPQFSWTGWSMGLAPALGSARNLLVTNGGRLISFDLDARAIAWQQRAGFTGTVSVGGGKIYVVNDGQVDVRRESDGGLIGPWVPPKGRVKGPILLIDNLFFASTETTTYAVDLETRRQVWSYPASGALALDAQGTLYIAQANGKLAAIGLR